MTKAETPSLSGLGVVEAVRDIAAGTIKSEDLVRDCLDRIDSHEENIQAWQHLDADTALNEAQTRDDLRARGIPTGRLHGVPIGIKDIMDTAYIPTERGSPIYEGRVPKTDSIVVERLRSAGAVIMGKTVTTEFAVMHPGKTRNPFDSDRTPGGSSSGSAAAVASYMVPGSLGTQTNGSIIRPASHCGVVGFKPTFGMIPRTGILMLSQVLDTVGVFARNVGDAALLAEVLMGADAGDADTAALAAVPPLSLIADQEPQMKPRLAFARSPAWEQTEPETREAFDELCDALQNFIVDMPIPEDCTHAVEQHRLIMNADLAHYLRREYETHGERISDTLKPLIETGRTVLSMDYARAMTFKAALTEAVEEMFEDVDAIITPAATGEAPLHPATGTGNPVFCTFWQFCGLPSVSLPLLQGPNGLPVGVQVVGRRGDDGRLLRTANWLMKSLQD